MLQTSYSESLLAAMLTSSKGSAKSRLYEAFASNYWNPPFFECCSEEGPSHLKIFTYKVTVYIEGASGTTLECFSEPRAKKKSAMEHASEGALWAPYKKETRLRISVELILHSISQADETRPYRHKPGTKSLREIRKFQKSTDLLLPAAPFIRIVKEITNNFSKEVSRWQAETLQALQESECSVLLDSLEQSACIPELARVSREESASYITAHS
ncbi:hypothetical protein MKX01_038786 [Papaver californicum]|nr:hypothetical protein MKX01_038786 [Papaver californicum]